MHIGEQIDIFLNEVYFEFIIIDLKIFMFSRLTISSLITCKAKLLKCDWLMRRAFFLNSGQKLLDPDWLRRFILSIRTKYQKHTQ